MRRGVHHTPAARARMGLSLHSLSALREDELRPLAGGMSMTVEQYAGTVGCSVATARARLNRLVGEGYAVRSRPPGGGQGGAYVYAVREQPA